MIRKTSLEKILEIESLKNKEYLVRKTGYDVNGDLIEAELRYKGCDGEIIYVGSQRFETTDKSQKICLDKEGLPYFKTSLGPITYRIYKKIFIDNTCFGAAMGGLNQQLLIETLKRVKKEKHPVYQEFKNYVNTLIKKAPKIKEAKDKKHYFNDESDLANYSELDLKIFEYLTAKDITFSRDDYNPNNYDVDDISLSQIQYVDFKTGSTKEEAAFILWYRNYMLSKGYEDKVEDQWSKSNKALKKWINKVSKRLEANGFKRIERFTYK